MKTSSWRLSSSSSGDDLKTSSRHFDQDEHIGFTHTSSEDVFKTSSRCLDQDQYIRLGHTSWRRLQDVLNMSCQDVFKTSSRRLAKTPSRHFQDILQTCLRDAFKMCHQVTLFYNEVILKLQLYSSFSFSLYYTLQWLLSEDYLEPGRTSTGEFSLQKYLTVLSC